MARAALWLARTPGDQLVFLLAGLPTKTPHRPAKKHAPTQKNRGRAILFRLRGDLISRRLDPVNMPENERRGELAALLSGALCRLGQKGRESSQNPDPGPCCEPECDSLVSATTRASTPTSTRTGTCSSPTFAAKMSVQEIISSLTNIAPIRKQLAPRHRHHAISTVRQSPVNKTIRMRSPGNSCSLWRKPRPRLDRLTT